MFKWLLSPLHQEKKSKFNKVYLHHLRLPAKSYRRVILPVHRLPNRDLLPQAQDPSKGTKDNDLPHDNLKILLNTNYYLSINKMK